MNTKLMIQRMYLENCTLSRWKFGGFGCVGLELPDLNNALNVSCIPEGEYECEFYLSPGKGYVVPQYINVPGRTFIQIHPANYTNQLIGCQAPGDGIKDINNDGVLDVTNSGATFKKLMSRLPTRFNVEIYS